MRSRRSLLDPGYERNCVRGAEGPERWRLGCLGGNRIDRRCPSCPLAAFAKIAVLQESQLLSRFRRDLVSL